MREKRNPERGEKIARAIARAGVCSRRQAEALVRAGRVAVNGFVVTDPAVRVGPEDEVLIDGEPLPAPEPVRLWRYHKPRGRIVSRRDEKGRPTIYDDLPEELRHVVPVGRLDFNSEGLLLLTNDGALARALERPSGAGERGGGRSRLTKKPWTRRYKVRAFGHVHPARLKKALEKLRNGIVIDGVRYAPLKATLVREKGANKWLTFALKEGKNREIRNICAHLGLRVNRLIRVAYGPFQLGALKRGAVEEVPRKQLAELLGGLLEGIEAERFAAHPRGAVERFGFDDEDEGQAGSA